MSAYPPPPGSKSTSTLAASGLPARPPPPAGGPRGFKPVSSQSGSYGSQGAPSFVGFAPRAVASGQSYKAAASPVGSAGPQQPSTYGAQPSYSAGYQPSGYQQGYYGQNYQDGYTGPTPPQIRNPFAPPMPGQPVDSTSGTYGAQPSADPDMDAQIAQWQSAYMAKDDPKAVRGANTTGVVSATGANSGPVSSRQDTEQKSGAETKPQTVKRTGGGQTWSDSSLLEWDPAHFRLFVGNLAGEVTDDSLLKAFAKYTSVQRARVIREKRTTKSKGYGFISFSDGDDYFKAARDMQGKYIGSHPVLIKKSTTEIKPVTQRDHRQQNRKNGKGGGGAHQNNGNGTLGAATGAGVGKKAAKTKGGLKILG